LKAGDRPALGQRDNTFPGVGASISSQCKNVEAAIKMLDYAYSDEGHMLFNFGVEGITYTLENGYPKYTELVTKDPKLPLANSMARYFRSVFNGPFVQDKRYIEQYAALPEQQEAIKIWREPSNEKQMPPVTQTQDESKRFASIMNDVVTLRDEAIIKIIVGQMAVSDWDNVVSQMKQIGIDEAIQLRQAALERFNKR
jgi:putative aldouronate transport system substrate-binding protein